MMIETWTYFREVTVLNEWISKEYEAIREPNEHEMKWTEKSIKEHPRASSLLSAPPLSRHKSMSVIQVKQTLYSFIIYPY
jgi:hypothetical protein